MSDWNHKYYEKHKPKLKGALIASSIIIVVILGLTAWERIAFYQTFPRSSENVNLGGVTLSVDTVARTVSSVWGFHLRIYVNLIADYPIADIEFQFNATRIWIIPHSGSIWPWRFYLRTTLVFYTEFENENESESNLRHYKFTCIYNSDTVDAIIGLNTSLDARWEFLHQKDIKL